MAVLGGKKEMNSRMNPCDRRKGGMTRLKKTREKDSYWGEKTQIRSIPKKSKTDGLLLQYFYYSTLICVIIKYNLY